MYNMFVRVYAFKSLFQEGNLVRSLFLIPDAFSTLGTNIFVETT